MDFNGTSIKIKLITHKIKQVDFAKKTGINEVRLSRILNNRVNPSETEKSLIFEKLAAIKEDN